MGREIRKVPPDWQHPVDSDGRYIPLYEGPFEDRAKRWDEDNAQWSKGLERGYPDKDHWYPVPKALLMAHPTYEDWDDPRPVVEEYMPTFAEGTATHYMIYENVSEGTPISPILETLEECQTSMDEGRWHGSL